ncbi:DUF6233 domain-containing protein [Streptomyces sp. NPDC002952]|uniref:DUF6233 domain-containing protein n=1 Tax=Streptomyces sp. NPDC002952 TaxID=3364673 RepID=UPI0036950634
MPDDLPSDLPRLEALRTWHALWLKRIDRKVAALRVREAERKRGEQARPPTPDFIVELSIGDGRPPVELHVGGCYAAGKRRRPVDTEEARRLLAAGLRPCTHCEPHHQLGALEQSPP